MLLMMWAICPSPMGADHVQATGLTPGAGVHEPQWGYLLWPIHAISELHVYDSIPWHFENQLAELKGSRWSCDTQDWTHVSTLVLRLTVERCIGTYNWKELCVNNTSVWIPQSKRSKPCDIIGKPTACITWSISSAWTSRHWSCQTKLKCRQLGKFPLK